jgi:hypothetical protein
MGSVPTSSAQSKGSKTGDFSIFQLFSAKTADAGRVIGAVGLAWA